MLSSLSMLRSFNTLSICSKSTARRFYAASKMLFGAHRGQVTMWNPVKGLGVIQSTGCRAALAPFEVDFKKTNLIGPGAVLIFDIVPPQRQHDILFQAVNVEVEEPLSALKKLHSIVGSKRHGRVIVQNGDIIINDDLTSIKFSFSEPRAFSEGQMVLFDAADGLIAQNVVPSPYACQPKQFSLEAQGAFLDVGGPNRLKGEVVQWNPVRSTGIVASEDGKLVVCRMSYLLPQQRSWMAVGTKVSFRIARFSPRRDRCVDLVIEEPSQLISCEGGSDAPQRGRILCVYPEMGCGFVTKCDLTYRFNLEGINYYQDELVDFQPVAYNADEGPVALVVGQATLRERRQGQSRFVVRCSSAESRTHHGVLDFWDDEKVFGFIKTDDNTRYFAGYNHLDKRIPMSSVRKGVKVKFDLANLPKNKVPEARRVLLDGVPIISLPLNEPRIGRIVSLFRESLHGVILDDKTGCAVSFHFTQLAKGITGDMLEENDVVEFEVFVPGAEKQRPRARIIGVSRI